MEQRHSKKNLALIALLIGTLLSLSSIFSTAAAQQQIYALEVYNDLNYGGNMCIDNTAQSGNIHSSCNDQTSSVALQAGWVVVFYKDANLQGAHRCIMRNDPDLSNNTFSDGSSLNNAISSYALYNQSTCPASSPEPDYAFEVYNNTNYQGSVSQGSMCFSDTAQSSNIHSNCNNQISSMMLRSGWSVLLYEGNDQTGAKRCMTANDANLSNNTFDDSSAMDNRISSYILYHQSTCPSLVDTTPPDGEVTAPADGITIGPGSVTFSANAWDNSGGSGVAEVEFHVKYNGNWYEAGTDSISPYEITWQTPGGLSSQKLIFTIHVIDQAGNEAMDPGGYHYVNFVESQGDPNMSENWVSAYKRAYLNQRSLPNGDVKCGATSMAMVLAMNGIIASDYGTMAAKANEMYPYTLLNGIAYVYKLRNELRRQGATSDYHYVSTDAGWSLIKQEVDAGRPVIVRTSPGVVTGAGHFFVAVGYKENNSNRQIITYDPFGRWLGTCCGNNYDANSDSSSSYKGRWVLYSFDTVFYDPTYGNNNYLITAKSPNRTVFARSMNSPDTPPDVISDEPEDITTYEGVEIRTGSQVFLPLILKNP